MKQMSDQSEILIDDLGDKYWYTNGLFHRMNGPAVEYTDGTKEWYTHGIPNREHGPAVEYADGTREWWVNGNSYTGNTQMAE